MRKRIQMRTYFLGLLATASTCWTITAAEPQSGPERWESDIAKFEAADKENPPTAGGVLFIGSSSIRMWKTLTEDFPNESVINRGFGGSEISDSIHFADRIVFPYKPRTIVLYAGDNDISRGKNADKVLDDYKTFVRTVRKNLPTARIAFIAIKPSLKRWELASEMKKANGKIRRYCALRRRLDYMDIWKPMLGKDGTPRPELFAKDGLHLNSEGYKLWTSVIRPFVAKR